MDFVQTLCISITIEVELEALYFIWHRFVEHLYVIT